MLHYAIQRFTSDSNMRYIYSTLTGASLGIKQPGLFLSHQGYAASQLEYIKTMQAVPTIEYIPSCWTVDGLYSRRPCPEAWYTRGCIYYTSKYLCIIYMQNIQWFYCLSLYISGVNAG